MRRTVERLLRRYGETVTLYWDGGEETVRAFLRPVTSKSLQNLRHSFDELGRVPDGLYVFLGPADCALGLAETAVCGGERFEPRQVEVLRLGGEAYYVWGLLTRGGAEDGGAA